MNSIWFDVLARCLMFSMLAVAANLVLGIAGQMTLAMAAFFGIGAYTAAILTIDHDAGFVTASVAAIAVSAAIGALLALPTMRVRGEYVVLLTLAFLSVANQMESSWIGLTGGATGKFPVPPLSLFGYQPVRPVDFVPILAVALAAMVTIGLLVAASPYGRSLKALRDDHVAARAHGVDAFAHQLSVFTLSSGLAGFVGALWAHYFAFITPSAFDLEQTIFIAAIVVLGGVGNMAGSIVAAFVLVSLPQVLRTVEIGSDRSAQIQQIAYGLLLIGFMVFRPQGLLREPIGRPPRLAGDPVPTTRSDPTHRAESGAGMLEARGLSKAFGGVRALDDVSITLPLGTVTALIGPNGAGKTTLFNVLTGDVRADAGTVLLGGRDITGLRPDRIVGLGVARTFQDVRLFPSLSAYDNVAMAVPDQYGASLRSLVRHPVRTFTGRREIADRVDRALVAVGFDGDPATPVGELGYGEQKLVALARLLATDPDVVLLDEPSAGTDAVWVERVLDIIVRLAAEGRAVCIVEHNLDLIRRLDGVAYFLDEGRVVAHGTVDELMSQRQLLETYLGLV